MATSDISQVCADIATTLGTVAGIVHAQSYDELTEEYPDVPMLQVYPWSGETDPSGGTDRTTFRAGVRQTDTLFYVDVPCRQRGNIDQDMAAVVAMQVLMQTKLEAQKTKSYFGNATIKAFSWRWELVTFKPGAFDFVGFRLFLTVRQF